MVDVRVCVGSSCHLRGGAKTLKLLHTLINDAGVQGQVSLRADLCLASCLGAPNVLVDGEPFGGVTPDRAEDFFRERILPKVRNGVGAGDRLD
ncbi:MAG: NAD(P)H-dependent oxidoreductase subunit E [Armatimonadota bacterium]|jgi:NADH:ubiquinone oxidoreductase subunit E